MNGTTLPPVAAVVRRSSATGRSEVMRFISEGKFHAERVREGLAEPPELARS